VVQAPTGQIPADTHQLALTVDAGNVHLFDPATGVRLGRADRASSAAHPQAPS